MDIKVDILISKERCKTRVFAIYYRQTQNIYRQIFTQGETMEEKKWTVKDILNAAMQKYYLSDGYTEATVPYLKNYEREIRRVMQKKCTLDKQPDGKKYIYAVTEREAKHLIDVDLYKYFKKQEDKEGIYSTFEKTDKEINLMEKELTESTMPDELEQLAAELVNDYEFDSEIDECIDRFMLRALFSLYYDFNEAEFRRDYKLMTNLVRPEEDETIKKGYSLLIHKLNDPLKYYCRKKRRKE